MFEGLDNFRKHSIALLLGKSPDVDAKRDAKVAPEESNPAWLSPNVEDVNSLHHGDSDVDVVGGDSDDEQEEGADNVAEKGMKMEAVSDEQRRGSAPLSARILEPTPTHAGHAGALSPLERDKGLTTDGGAPVQKSSLKGASPPKGLLGPGETKRNKSVQFGPTDSTKSTDAPPSTATASASSQGSADMAASSTEVHEAATPAATPGAAPGATDTPASASTPEDAEAKRKRERREKIAAAKAKREAEGGEDSMFSAAPAEVVGVADGSVSWIPLVVDHPHTRALACTLHSSTRYAPPFFTPYALRSSVRPKSRHEHRRGAAAGR